jgi:pSer/pThr/pTyr-binding forkhead associated (FHA) protein
LNSPTGTWVNGERVQQTSLASGDEIRLGPHRLLLQAPGLRPERVIVPEVQGRRSRAWVGWLVTALAAAAVTAWYFQLLPVVG